MSRPDDPAVENRHSTYKTPLAIQFEFLITGWEELLNDEIIPKLSSSEAAFSELREIATSLDASLFQLQLWSRDVAVNTDKDQYSAFDGLEMVDKKPELAEKIREILDKIELAMAEARKAYNNYHHGVQHSALQDLLQQSVKLVEAAKEFDLQKNSVISTIIEAATIHEAGASTKAINVICFDGGGVRSYASLLVLKALMDEIRAVIKEDRRKAGSHETEYDLRPRDVFDLFVGSSSGGLLATMLGRLRTTESECIDRFRDYADGIFGHPRLVWHICPWFVRKYSNRNMKKAISNAVGKYGPRPNGEEWKRNLFEFSGDRCKTALVAYQVQEGQRSGTAYLFRTYTNPTSPDPPNSPTSSSTTDVQIWEAAQATSAAPQFFKPIKIGDMAYFDGGLGFNNPSMCAFTEASMITGRESHSICLISIGSGTKDSKLSGPIRVGSNSLVRRQSQLYRMLVDTVTDTERAHREVASVMKLHGSPYYRFDPSGLGQTKSDEWRVSYLSDGKKDFLTIKHIEEAVEKYLKSSGVLADLRECAKSIVYNRRARL